jgi:DNA-binding NarL/FixJ family response regulator
MEKIKVLVIEDDSNILDNVLELLSINGYQSFGAENGTLGLKLMQEIQPNIVLCDIKLPDINGFEVLRNMRENLKLYIPFIFVTAKAERDSQRIGMNLGADDYITKPFTSKELKDSIQSRLKRQHLNSINNSSAVSILPSHYDKLLTKTERQIVDKIKEGKTTQKIASEMFTSPKTVVNHRYNIAKKLNLKGTYSLARFIINRGWEGASDKKE